MTLSRQQAFQQLRTPCVELSSVALTFKGKQAPVKDVLHALEAARHVLSTLAEKDALDEKLAEYAFFPLTHIFNEAQRLSTSCLEAATDCVIILVAKGWRHHLAPDMGKQLLILMTLMGAPDPRKQAEPPSDELKETCLVCIDTIVVQLTGRQGSKHLFNDVGTKSIADQLVYMLLETITENESDRIQSAAAEALLHLMTAISNRVLLASLLPRTASSLTHVLKPSSNARRTRKVLILYLHLLTSILQSVLADAVVYPLDDKSSDQSDTPSDQSNALDNSWLRATASQVKLVLAQVTKLRDHQSSDVRLAVAGLCLMVAHDCSKSLSHSIPVVVECLLSICQSEDGAPVLLSLKSLANLDADIGEIVRNKFNSWCQSLPRVMQGNEERHKLRLLAQLGSSIDILKDISFMTDDALAKITKSMLTSLSVQSSGVAHLKILQDAAGFSYSTNELVPTQATSFQQLVLECFQDKPVFSGLQHLLSVCASNGLSTRMARICLNQIDGGAPSNQVSAIWLALASLRDESTTEISFSGMVNIDTDHLELSHSRPSLISELYTTTLPFLLNESDLEAVDGARLRALAIECTVLQAQQLGEAYRPELMDTLYPILSLLGQRNQLLRAHAMTGLDMLAQACAYQSTSDMLVGNVDYLINSVALKLNSFDISPQAPYVVLTMLRLCGTGIVPYLDDLIGCIFSALDNFHGYARLVELLFRILKGVVDETKAKSTPLLGNSTRDFHQNPSEARVTSVADVVEDLRRRKTRKRKHEADLDERQEVPHRPWTSGESRTLHREIDDEMQEMGSENNDPEKALPREEDPKTKLSKTHQLLLDIAKSASPHLSSPSPQVRHLLLELIEEVSPRLAQDESTFLPLINTVWPSVVARMLSVSDDLQDPETSYNVCAAADTIAVLCRDAGNFMSTRIDEVFPKIRKLFVQVQGTSMPNMSRPDRNPHQVLSTVSETAVVTTFRNSRTQILAALTRLLTTVINHVRITDDIGDEIMNMLAPFARKQESGEIKRALETYNVDAFWLLDKNKLE